MCDTHENDHGSIPGPYVKRPISIFVTQSCFHYVLRQAMPDCVNHDRTNLPWKPTTP